MNINQFVSVCVLAVLCLVRFGEGFKCHQCFWSKVKTSGDFASVLGDIDDYDNPDCESGGSKLPAENAIECSLPFWYTGRTDIETYCNKITMEGKITIDALGVKVEIDAGSRDCHFYDPTFSSISSRPNTDPACVNGDEFNPFNELEQNDISGLIDVNMKNTFCACNDVDGCNGAGHVTVSLFGAALFALLAALLKE